MMKIKKFHSKEISGFSAIVYQHEIDHLDGILFTDKVSDNKSLVSNSNYLKYHEKKRILKKFLLKNINTNNQL